ncbi:MAG: hypothetical protein K8S99_07865 [Planctomycetes bacterium]|nr:hypothetical protein [Planctomycetota bacterium]
MTLQADLKKLYLLDMQLRGLRSRLDGAISRQQKQTARLEQLRQQRKELGEQVKLMQVKASTVEKQSQDMEARIATLRNQMNSVKNNKEYSALLIEVNTLKNDKGKVEEEALTHMTKVDELKKQAEELDGKITEQAKLVGVSETEVKACEAELGQQLTDLTAQRDAAATLVPPESLATFNKLAYRFDGEAMASIVEENRRTMEYNCAGCYIGLPAERLNRLMRKPDEIVVCPSCGRILYIEEELRTSLASSK